MQGHIRTATSLCLVLLALSLAGRPADAWASMPLTDDPAAQGLLRLGAVLQLGGLMLNFRIASDNFWRLVIVNGLEAIVGPPPGQ